MFSSALPGLSGILGGFIGGAIMTKYKFDLVDSTKMIIFSLMVTSVGIGGSMLITCPQIDLAGNWNEDHSRCVRVRSDVTLVTIFCTFFYCSVSLDMPCNSNCSCELSKNTQSLVCDENGLTHFSPCFAGCDVDSKVNNPLPHPSHS